MRKARCTTRQPATRRPHRSHVPQAGAAELHGVRREALFPFRARSGSRRSRGVRVGLLICEDIWEAEPAARAARAGAEMLMVINASPFDIPQAATTRGTARAPRARERRRDRVCQRRRRPGRSPLRRRLAARRTRRTHRRAGAALTDALLVRRVRQRRSASSSSDWPTADESLEVARLRGTRARHSRLRRQERFPGVLLGLSGGIDSALSLALAVDALGAERVTAVRMPSRYTSGPQQRSAEAQARKLGVDYYVLPIEAPVRGVSLDARTGRSRSCADETTHRRKPAVALPRRHADGAVEQISAGWC